MEDFCKTASPIAEHIPHLPDDLIDDVRATLSNISAQMHPWKPFISQKPASVISICNRHSNSRIRRRPSFSSPITNATSYKSAENPRTSLYHAVKHFSPSKSVQDSSTFLSPGAAGGGYSYLSMKLDMLYSLQLSFPLEHVLAIDTRTRLVCVDCSESSQARRGPYMGLG